VLVDDGAVLVLLPNDTIDLVALHKLVEAEYGCCDPPVFAPVGGDSWCFHAAPWFVSVRRDRNGHWPEAYEAACRLADGGLAFVLAPRRGTSGRVVHNLDGFPVLALPLVNERPLYPPGPSLEECAQLAEMLGELHAATTEVELPRETFNLRWERELRAGTDRALAGAAAAGPFGAAVTTLVRENVETIEALTADAASVRNECRALDPALVITHGEAAGNLLATTSGELNLIDWGALRLAPPERDFAGLRDFGYDAGGRPILLRFYALDWILSEIAEYVDEFTRPHADSIHSADKWRELRRYLPSDVMRAGSRGRLSGPAGDAASASSSAASCASSSACACGAF